MMRGADTASKIEVSPRLGALLTQVTEVPDLEAALWKVLSEYIDLKIAYMQRQIQEFESKWNMTFAEFAERCEAGTLDEDSHSYEVESDYWEWEAAVTLLQHYSVCKLDGREVVSLSFSRLLALTRRPFRFTLVVG